MARSDCYKSAKYAVAIHKMLKDVSEMEGIDGWVAAKITKAADYLGSVKHYMEGQAMSDVELAVVPVAGDMTDAMTVPQESVEEVHEADEEKTATESIEEAVVTENAERIIKVSNIDYAGPALDKLPTETTLKLNIPYDADEDDVYDMVADELEDRHGVKVDGFDMNFAESVEEDEDIIGNIIGKLAQTKAGQRGGKDVIGDIIAKLPKEKKIHPGIYKDIEVDPKAIPPAPMPEPKVSAQQQQKMANRAMALPKAPRSMGQDKTTGDPRGILRQSKFSEWSKK
jgi:hypothetical protein